MSTLTWRGFLLRRCQSLLDILALFSILAMFAGLFGRWHFLLDLASHFRIQATIVIAVFSLVMLCRQRWWTATGSLAVLFLLLGSLSPFLLPTSTATNASTRLFAMNVLTSNRTPEKVVEQILASDADFVVLSEVSPRLVEYFDRALTERWPHTSAEPREDNFGIVLYSKTRWAKCEVVDFGTPLGLPGIVAEFSQTSGAPLRLVALHPLPPMRSFRWEQRNTTFAEVADLVHDASQRTIVVGDLNCTPWSYWFGKLLKDSGLRNAAIGQGIGVSWSPINFWGAGLPIDHALVGDEIAVASRTIGGAAGSDHRAVVLDFAVGDKVVEP